MTQLPLFIIQEDVIWVGGCLIYSTLGEEAKPLYIVTAAEPLYGLTYSALSSVRITRWNWDNIVNDGSTFLDNIWTGHCASGRIFIYTMFKISGIPSSTFHGRSTGISSYGSLAIIQCGDELQSSIPYVENGPTKCIWPYLYVLR